MWTSSLLEKGSQDGQVEMPTQERTRHKTGGQSRKTDERRRHVPRSPRHLGSRERAYHQRKTHLDNGKISKSKESEEGTVKRAGLQQAKHRHIIVAHDGRDHLPRGDHRPTDSYVIHVNNCASRCITHSLSDFVRPPQKVVRRVKEMGGNKVAVSAVEIIRWTFDDDEGMTHAFLILRSLFLIPGSLNIPESPARLFSPQHWAQERKDDLPKKNGTWKATFADHVNKLVWGQEAFQKRIPLDKSNVASFTTTARCKEFRVFRACLEEIDGCPTRKVTLHVLFFIFLNVEGK